MLFRSSRDPQEKRKAQHQNKKSPHPHRTKSLELRKQFSTSFPENIPRLQEKSALQNVCTAMAPHSDEAPRSLPGTFFILSYSSQNTEQKLIHFTFLSQQMMLSSRQDGPEREIPPLIPPRSSLPRLDMAFLSNHNEVREERRGRTSPNPVGLMEERIRT